MNVVYEFLNSLSEAAGAYGKREEYGPLANDASALDNARQDLSTYIEQAAGKLEMQAQKPDKRKITCDGLTGIEISERFL